MKKNLIICAIMLFAAAFGLSAQNLDKAKADMKKMLGDWTYSMENPMDGEKIEGAVSIIQEKDAVFMNLGGVGAAPIKTSAFIPAENGQCQTSFYIEEYDYDVPMSLKLVDEGTVKVTIDAGGFYVEYNMIRKK